MNSSISRKIRPVVDKIVSEFQPQKIILYGSWARGKPTKNSDVDFFVIKETDQPVLKRTETLDRLFPRRDFAMDFLVYTPAQVEKERSAGDPFVNEILSKGKILYDIEKTALSRS